jgi:WD40 repeat protein
MVLSRDSRRVAIVVDQVRVRQWNLVDGSAVGPDLVRPDQVYAIDYSPNGERLAKAEWAGAAMIWDAATGTPMGTSGASGGRSTGPVQSGG